MSRFQLSLRDVLVFVTAICVQLALFGLLFQLSSRGQEWLIAALDGLVLVMIPMALAIVVSVPRRHARLLSFVLGFVTIVSLCGVSSVSDPFWRLATEYGVIGNERPLWQLLILSFAFSIGLVCSWLTRSLMPGPH